ncbi:4-amino-4-deoxy-L-arabinose transferase-like glycosyltransferase [Rhodanobacter sp. ANJX3]|uniref:hypothetical protein n=1 Tax=Rhodanobacter sp. ANJX3 TaxID=2723083 RepID=UPI00160CE3D4|nr:hypothetical protein [Rhodanobacter sp. ANJX3]MBB5358055.1 4-amino-4-deoxy-L-arabinose transferase-like glycosyltransferase [Rhodanobacter sp. ANJX3]
MKGTSILAFVTATLWALILLMGFGGIDTVRSQHVPGYPSVGQIHYYVYVPATLLALVIFTWALAARWQRFKILALAIILLALLFFPGYLFFYTGGV